MIVIWDNVDWLMRGWSFVPHLCTILIGQSDIIDGCCLKVKVVAEVNWFDFGSIECEWSFCPFSMLCVKIGLEVIFRCASFSRSHFVSQSESDWYLSIAVRTSHKKIRILEFCWNFGILSKFRNFDKISEFCLNPAQISEIRQNFGNLSRFQNSSKFHNFVKI